LLGDSNVKAQKRLEAMTKGTYGIRDMKAALEGTGVKLVRQKLEDPILPESLLPGSYVFGVCRVHVIGVRVREDRSVEVHDNLCPGGIGQFPLGGDVSAWRVSLPEVVGQKISFPWSVHRFLGCSNEAARRRLEAMSSGPYGIHDMEAALEGTGVELVRLKLQDSHLIESLLPGNYILGRRGHVIGLCVREDHSLEVHDNECPAGIGQFSLAAYRYAWKLSSK